MGLEMVLNDLSMLPPAEDIYVARQRMSKLVDTLIAAVSLKVERALRTEYDINVVELTTGYLVARWLNDAEVDRETRRYFRSLATKAPYLKDVKDPKIQDMYDFSLFFHGQIKAAGLGVAFLLDALAISFHSHSVWETSSLQLSLEQLQEDNTISNHVVLVQHACFREHILKHSDWISRRVRVNVESGVDLCIYYETLYPHLQFCASVISQMQALPRGEIHLRQIMKHLLDLNNYCNNWREESFSPERIAGKITVESDATLTMYAKEHTFLCPDGVERKFSWHCRVTPEPWRIYFLPREDERNIIIGHIGEHLPTIKFH